MIKKIQTICEDFAKNRYFNGVCLIKKGNKNLFSFCYGLANRSFDIPITMNTMFDTASITKIFTATAVLMLIEKGKLNFEDKIVDIIDLHNTKISKSITIEHLLTHTSGIADDADEEAGEEYSDLFINIPNYSFRQAKDYLKNFIYKEPNFEPGTNIRYNNCDFILLALVIEKISKINYRDFVTKNIFKKCHMNNTKFCAMDEINKNVAEGYYAIFDKNDNFIKFKKNIYMCPPIGSGDAGAFTTALDLDKFIRAIKDNKLLSKKYSKLLFTPHCKFTRNSSWKAVPNHIRYGYAFEFIEIDNKIFSIYKDGSNYGVANITSYYPESDITVTILCNTECNVWEMNRKIQTEIYNL